MSSELWTSTQDFYTSVLDFVVDQAPDPDAFLSRYAVLARDGSFVHLSAHSGNGVFGNVICIRVADEDATYKKFLINGVRVPATAGVTMEPVNQTWGMREFSIADPDTNSVTFSQHLR